ncbi:hypothetical protein F5Y03DRAFT_218205 [Xylaria venustula]|nr:hypothetical protein F5Y03DRAFT_218205 [Xylaria venustula]
MTFIECSHALSLFASWSIVWRRQCARIHNACTGSIEPLCCRLWRPIVELWACCPLFPLDWEIPLVLATRLFMSYYILVS